MPVGPLYLSFSENWLSVILKALLAIEAAFKIGIVVYGYFLQKSKSYIIPTIKKSNLE